MATTPKPISQAKLKKHLIDLIKGKNIRIDFIEMRNHKGQVPHSTLTVNFTDVKNGSTAGK